MSNPHHHRKLPETLKKATTAAQEQRGNTADLKLGIVQVNI